MYTNLVTNKGIGLRLDALFAYILSAMWIFFNQKSILFFVKKVIGPFSVRKMIHICFARSLAASVQCCTTYSFPRRGGDANSVDNPLKFNFANICTLQTATGHFLFLSRKRWVFSVHLFVFYFPRFLFFFFLSILLYLFCMASLSTSSKPVPSA